MIYKGIPLCTNLDIEIQDVIIYYAPDRDHLTALFPIE